MWTYNEMADAVLLSGTARLVVWNSDIALAALQATPTQIQRQRTIPGRLVHASTGMAYFEFAAHQTRGILIRRWYSGNETEFLCWQRNASSTQSSSTGIIQPGGTRTLYNVANYGCALGTYTSSGVRCNADNDNANFVAAFFGLARTDWYTGAPLYVLYVLV
jgi:hypothetical protein